ncbi:hypothetical protein VFPPC_16314 [Pochonia chlamydosporia 170]|uniref:Uncharacterized protein n=1 Tax=Pochonia chlamydosporia 170 TaxID=1380566 RepID=A0A179FI18_METCM|nr:hypothetical protein VFPPC_16314 [Pochonia chlamydosporia 170]OAQ65194.1 hypothetical protein VFPPC_16314 [Pochonia chlamydosporia 170]
MLASRGSMVVKFPPCFKKRHTNLTRLGDGSDFGINLFCGMESINRFAPDFLASRAEYPLGWVPGGCPGHCTASHQKPQHESHAFIILECFWSSGRNLPSSNGMRRGGTNWANV